jgi:archaemetzincin
VNSARPQTILIAPMGDFDPRLLSAVGREIERVFHASVCVRPLLDDWSFAFDAGREQFHSTPILRRLSDAAPPEAFKVLALADVDLFIPILTHVYGEAQLGGKACIVSTHRLNAGSGIHCLSEKAFARVAKEAVHELGHTFNLRHCTDSACVMHYCRSEADVDRKSSDLCRYCRVMLDDERRRMELIEKN